MKNTLIIASILIIIVIAVVVFRGGKQEQTPVDNTVATETTQEAITTNTSTSTTKPMTDQQTKTQKAVFTTSMGSFTIALSPETAPKTVANFVKLAQSGFYTGIKFHRVIQGFMIQAGDPLSKDDTKKSMWGTGGPGYKFDDELTGKETYPQGTFAMANAGPNTNGSQFFIVTATPGAPLPPSYTVFGHVVSGIDVPLAIEKVQTTLPGVADRPVTDIVINSITIE
jgi:cyclophilin family peptidyl-prolyl cis-trans isomerase